MMESTKHYASDVAFTPTVKLLQSRKGSRHAYARMEQNGSWETAITPELKQFIEEQTSIFMATANSEGQPYIQHRGGPAGFLRVLDEQTIGFVDFPGNRQYVSTGNLTDNPKAHLFLIDYANKQRVKIWGDAKVVEGADDLIAKLLPQHYQARAEHVIIFKVTAWDANCPKHIPQRFEANFVAAALAERDRKIAKLEVEIKRLRVGGQS